MSNPVVLKHGAFSTHTRKRYSDKRTSEGKQLAGIIQGIVDDLGGPEGLTASQRLLLDGIRSKLVVILQVGKYADEQKSLIDPDGQVLACLRSTFLSYQESLRRDLECLHGLDRRQKKPGPSLAEWIKENATK